MFTACDVSHSKEKWNEIEKILAREDGLYEELKNTLENVK